MLSADSRLVAFSHSIFPYGNVEVQALRERRTTIWIGGKDRIPPQSIKATNRSTGAATTHTHTHIMVVASKGLNSRVVSKGCGMPRMAAKLRCGMGMRTISQGTRSLGGLTTTTTTTTTTQRDVRVHAKGKGKKMNRQGKGMQQPQVS